MPPQREWMAWLIARPGLAIALIVAVHLAFLSAFYQPAISGPDTNGYMAQARLIAREGVTGIVVESPEQFVGSHWMPTTPGTYFGQYPPGLPAILAVPFHWLGPGAALWTNALLGSLTLLGVYLVGRTWAGPGWGLLAALLMAFNPVANQHAVEADAHTAVGFFLVWGLVFLTRWDRSGKIGWASAAGLCLGVVPTIRYPEALFGLVFAGFIALASKPARDRLISLTAFGLAALAPMLALFARNQYAFGAFWKTGYSVSGEQTAFSLGNFARHFVPYVFFLVIAGVFLVSISGVVGAWVLARRPETRRTALLLIGLVVPITALYMAYYWSAGSMSMRFLVPTFPLYALATVLWLQVMSGGEPVRARRYAKVLLGSTAAWGLALSIVGLWSLRSDNATLATITRAIQQAVPPGSIVIADDGLQQHLDFVGDWKLARARMVFGRGGGPPGMREEPKPKDADAPENQAKAVAFRDAIAAWATRDQQARAVYWVASADQIGTL
jgi:4-amino-4-deoxy-L-arabinose transferase-like glycosyltransferase